MRKHAPGPHTFSTGFCPASLFPFHEGTCPRSHAYVQWVLLFIDQLGKSEGGGPSIFFSPSPSLYTLLFSHCFFYRPIFTYSTGYCPASLLPFHEDTCPRPTFLHNWALLCLVFLPFHGGTCPRPHWFLCNGYYYLSRFAIPLGHEPHALLSTINKNKFSSNKRLIFANQMNLIDDTLCLDPKLSVCPIMSEPGLDTVRFP